MQNMTEPIKKEEAPVQPPEQTPEQKVETPEEQKPNVPQDIDYDKELEALKGKTPPPTRSEKEKAAFTVKKLITKFPDIKGELGESEEEPLEDKFGQFSQSFLRQQAESEIRKRSKSESETQYKLWFYYTRYFGRSFRSRFGLKLTAGTLYDGNNRVCRIFSRAVITILFICKIKRVHLLYCDIFRTDGACLICKFVIFFTNNCFMDVVLGISRIY